MSWRLIPYVEADGPWNMAVDEAIFQSFIDGASPPTLRFYGWSEPWVSIGRLQPIENVPEGWGRCLVRRPTGGRAVRHGGDLTFSAIVSSRELGSPIIESYRKTAEAVQRALVEVGVPARMCRVTTPPSSVRSIGACFDLTLDYELVVGERKVFGSAQVRRSGAVLQQNSLVLLGIERERLIDSITHHMERVFTANIRDDVLSENELQIARHLADNKYARLRATAVNL